MTFLCYNDCRNKIPFTVSADNSMFSVYDFFSRHLNTAVIKETEEGVPVFHFQGQQW